MHMYYMPEAFKYFKCINSFNSHQNLMRRYHYYLCLTEAQERLRKLFEKMLLLVGNLEFYLEFECMQSGSKA